MNIRSPDYQQFELTAEGITKIGPRISQKLKAIELPDLQGKEVLDIGCDYGFWSFHSAFKGAKRVLGLDRNRSVKGIGLVDLIETNRSAVRDFQGLNACEFENVDIGKQWKTFGSFDVVYLFSLYHHIYQNTGGDHASIWFWLWNQVDPSGVLIWENPLTAKDSVVQRNVDKRYHDNYNDSEIIYQASRYFDIDYAGPALHEETREVLRLYPLQVDHEFCAARAVNGAGGASKAFLYENSRRSKEIQDILGFEPFPGSLNLSLEAPFDWTRGYYRSQILDVADRSKGINSEWKPRWARFYPVLIDGEKAFAFRFEGERYPENFVELISPIRLRDKIRDEAILCR